MVKEKKVKRSYHYTREHQLELEARRKIKEEKKKAEQAKKKADSAKAKAKRIQEALTGAIVENRYDDTAIVKKIIEGRPVVFQPNKGPQTDFLASPEEDVLYGGAAGRG